jgi:asparagine synthase (glutamine-hydrolysing)
MMIDPVKDTPIQRTQYWDFNFREPTEKASDEEYHEELDRLFKQAVQRQLMTDVELGSYLSGGIDSGSITAVASQSYPGMKTFTCGFDMHSASGIELAFDERERAEMMSYHCGTEQYEMVLKAGDMERILPKLAWHLEEPRVGQSYPNYYAAQLASKFVKVVLSGTGGDEMFAGYPWRYYRNVVNDDFDNYIDKYYQFWQRLIPNAQIKDVFSPIWNDVKHVWTRDIFKDVFQSHAETMTTPEDYINHSLYFEAKTFLHGLLVVEDKLSMAHGLESRVPFLDNDLVDFAMRCPVHLKLNNLTEVSRINENEPGNKTEKYFQKTKDGKQILRDVIGQYIPKNISQATKQGFSGPDGSWFQGDSIEFVKGALLNNNAPIYEYMDRKSVQSLINDHLDGDHNRRLLIWSLLNFNETLRA